jgi:hypothetical protein
MISNIKKKNIIYVVLILLLLINIFTATIIFIDIQIISAPKTEIFIDISEVNSDEIIINSKLKMSNNNRFDIGIKDFMIISMNYDEVELGRMKISGGNIPSDESRIFSTTGKFVLKETSNLTILKNRIIGKISVTFLGFITKTIPIDLMVITSIREVFDNIEIPDVDIQASLTDINEEGISLEVNVNVYNPTSLMYNVKDLYMNVITDQGVSAGNISITGGVIEPKKSCMFYSNGTLFFEAFDAETINLNLNGVVGAKVGGINKNVSFSTDASLIVPDLKEFVFGGQEVEFQIPVQFKLTLQGILSNVGFSIYNPSNVSLIGDNLRCLIYRKDGEKMTLLGQDTMKPCLVHPDERICVKTQIIIPYLKYLLSYPYRLLPDWIVLTIEGDFFIAGTRQAIPLSLNAYVDPNIITQKEFH